MKKILISGFEPFGGAERNISAEVALGIGDMYDSVVAKVLPVSFSKAPAMLLHEIRSVRPDIILMLGLASKRHEVSIERIAINLMDSVKPDNDGYLPKNEKISSRGREAYFTSFPVREIASAVEASGTPSAVSNSAGLYVCNSVYYSALQYVARSRRKVSALFVHLPLMDVHQAVKSVDTIIEEIIKDE